MLIFLTLLLVFIYFKIARVHNKEEKLTLPFVVQHIMVLALASLTFYHAFLAYSWYMVLLVSFAFFIVAALMVTAVQLGIFVDGKPLFGVSHLYKYLPLLTVSILSLTILLTLV